MDQLLDFIYQHVDYAPWISFGALCLAGFNLPVSEDAMLFINALLAQKFPDRVYALFLGVYAGAYISDLICYGLGRKIGPKLWRIRWFAKMVSEERVAQVSRFYKRYGMMTLILGRFIPFGVRNGLFLTAGLGKMNFRKFALSDLLACTISCSTFFYLYFTFGESVVETVKKGNMILFGIAFVFVLALLYRKKLQRK